MRNLLKKLLRQDGHEHVLTPRDESARFDLLYGSLPVGTLWLEDGGEWRYAYADAFRQQTEVKPLVDFPHLDKQYVSDELWPFFAVRIPSLEQPAVQREIAERDLDEHNQVALLRAFGTTSISNPFVLKPAW
ncbi:MAG: HipA N-terminal domain-containing protein [Bacteroidota bacterium]